MMNITDNNQNDSGTSNTNIDVGGGLEFNAAPVVTAQECERLVESVKPFPLEEVGSEQWLQQHEVLEKLNMQAHHCAKANTDDFVLESLVTFDKLPTIVHELIVIEAWRENVYPVMEKDVLRQGSSMRAYFTLYHEATLANLLETVMYHDYAAESVGDSIIELIDWCARRLIYLNALPSETHSLPWAPEPTKRKDRKKKEAASSDEAGDKDYVDPEVRAEIKAMAAQLDQRSPEDDLRQQYLSVQFRVATAAVTILRYLCAQGSKLGVSVLSRLSDTHDVMTLIIPLIDNPPWTRRLKSTGTWEKWQDQKWSECKPENLLKLTKLEAQAWLTVYNLISDEQFRKRYQFNSYRKDALLRIRKYINDVMVDQLPMFADVQRFMDELAIAGSNSAPDNGTALVMEIMPEIRNAIMAKYAEKGDWANLAMEQLRTTFSGGDMDTKDKGLAALADLYSGDALASLMADQEMSPEDRRGRLITAQIATYVTGNELTSVSKFLYNVEAARPAPQTTSGGMFERYKLSRTNEASGGGRPVPSDGSMLVTLCFENGSMVEARSDALVLPGQDYVWPASDVSLNTDVPMDENSTVPNSKWIKIGSIDERNVIQIQMVKNVQGGLRPLWSAPSMDISSRKEGEQVVLDMYTVGSVFVSLPMLSKGQQKLFEEKMATIPNPGQKTEETTNTATATTKTAAAAAAAAAAAVVETTKKNTTAAFENKMDDDEGQETKVEKKGPLIQDVTEVDELD